jgi:hypothetical protein
MALIFSRCIKQALFPRSRHAAANLSFLALLTLPIGSGLA